MGTVSISLVPRISEFKNKEERANRIIDWLIEIDAIKPIKSNCVLGLEEFGYAISNGAKKIVTEPDYLPYSLSANGLEVEFGRQIFTTMENGIDTLICPNCDENIAEEDWDFFNEWTLKESNNLTCPKCQKSNEIHSYTFEPIWGFSDLGFVFWNWVEFKKEFLEEFENRIGCEIDMVYAHL